MPNSSDATNVPLFISQLQAQRQAAPHVIQSTNDLLAVSPFFSSQGSITPQNQASAKLDRQEDTSQISGPLGRERPASTPLESSDTYNAWIPPRRELPFPNLRGSSKDLPPLPKPTPVSKVDAAEKTTVLAKKESSTPVPKPAKKRVAQRKSTAAKPPEEKLLAEPPPVNKTAKEPETDRATGAQEDEPSPLAAKSAAARPPSAASGLQSKAAPTKKRGAAAAPVRPSSSSKRPKMVDQGTQTQKLLGHDHTITMKPIPSNEVSVPITVEETSPAPPPHNYLDELDAFITRHKARPAPKELWEAPRYAEADEEQRQLILNDFICENLENEDFLQLCEDTEKAWRRIGLGM